MQRKKGKIKFFVGRLEKRENDGGMKEEDQKIQLKKKVLSHGKFGTREKKGV